MKAPLYPSCDPTVRKQASLPSKPKKSEGWPEQKKALGRQAAMEANNL
jgi:hypothetical protein